MRQSMDLSSMDGIWSSARHGPELSPPSKGSARLSPLPRALDSPEPTRASRKALEACEASTSELVEQAKQRLLDASEYADAQGIFGKLSVGLLATMAALSEADAATLKSKLSEQKAAFSLRLETQRKSSQVAMRTQAVELHAVQEREVHAARASLMDGGVRAFVEELQAELAELREQVDKCTAREGSDREVMRQLREAQRTAERRAAAAEEADDTLWLAKQRLDDENRQLREALAAAEASLRTAPQQEADSAAAARPPTAPTPPVDIVEQARVEAEAAQAAAEAHK